VFFKEFSDESLFLKVKLSLLFIPIYLFIYLFVVVPSINYQVA